MRKLILNDGTEIENASALLSSGTLFLYLGQAVNMVQAFDLLIDPEITERITYQEFDSVKVFDGYTDLTFIRKEDDGSINAGMKEVIVE